jgi:hypothetical protein
VGNTGVLLALIALWGSVAIVLCVVWARSATWNGSRGAEPIDDSPAARAAALRDDLLSGRETAVMRPGHEQRLAPVIVLHTAREHRR